MSYSNDMYKAIILDHVENPRNKHKDHTNYLYQTLKNPSCGDIITVYAKMDGTTIEDITYDVSGCSICSASASIMSDLLKGKTIEEMETILSNFNQMVMGNAFDEDLLEEAICLKGVAEVPTRIKCATLGYKALKEAISKGGAITNE
ncbi:MAG: SUF system NifU family Fe-S cluster assembly protein [Bacilli bacterium]|nr:SUF system NifU family Fe-S cluster assembly protein [Bacilli bacterium]